MKKLLAIATLAATLVGCNVEGLIDPFTVEGFAPGVPTVNILNKSDMDMSVKGVTFNNNRCSGAGWTSINQLLEVKSFPVVMKPGDTITVVGVNCGFGVRLVSATIQSSLGPREYHWN
jgi:hypothetical protein